MSCRVGAAYSGPHTVRHLASKNCRIGVIAGKTKQYCFFDLYRRVQRYWRWSAHIEYSSSTNGAHLFTCIRKFGRQEQKEKDPRWWTINVKVLCAAVVLLHQDPANFDRVFAAAKTSREFTMLAQLQLKTITPP